MYPPAVNILYFDQFNFLCYCFLKDRSHNPLQNGNAREAKFMELSQ
jgi:hypothetical protein